MRPTKSQLGRLIVNVSALIWIGVLHLRVSVFQTHVGAGALAAFLILAFLTSAVLLFQSWRRPPEHISSFDRTTDPILAIFCLLGMSILLYTWHSEGIVGVFAR